MADVLQEKIYLFFKNVLYLFGEFFELTVKRFRGCPPHFRKCAISSAVVLNGPESFPASASRKLACSQRGSFFFAAFVIIEARGRTGADSSSFIFASSTRTRFSRVTVVMYSYYH